MTRKQRLFAAGVLMLSLVILGAPGPVWWAVTIPLAIVEAIYSKRRRIAANGCDGPTRSALQEARDGYPGSRRS